MMSDHSIPMAREIPVDAVSEPDRRGWYWGVAQIAGIWAVLALVWWLTGADVMYGAIVAATALGDVGRGAVTAARAAKHLTVAADLALLGVVALGSTGLGLSVSQRLVQGGGGLVVAALVWVAVCGWQRRAGGRTSSRN